MSEVFPLTGVERTFGVDELIVSKTNPRGIISYANEVFLRVAQYDEREVLGRPHNLIRHPEMPRCVFKLLWDEIQAGREIFAYVLNRTKLGDHYWVFAHVTPSHDALGRLVGYHSNRRLPSRTAIQQIKPLYRQLLSEERRHAAPRDACEASGALLKNQLAKLGVTYDDFVFSLARDSTSIAHEQPAAPVA